MTADPTDPATPLSGAALGFQMRSPLSFRLLRPATGRALEIVENDGAAPDLDGEPLLAWDATPDNPFARRIYARDGGFAVWNEAIGWFLVDPDRPSIAIPPHADLVRREERMLGLPAALCVIRGGDIVLHGSAVDVGGSAILFCAPGHFGKTTLAGSFLQAGYRLLADDMSCCRLEPEPAMLPGPAVLRIRPDVYGRVEFPGTEPIAEDEHKIHLMLGATERGTGSPVPIRAIVFLQEAPEEPGEGMPPLRRISAQAALPNLWTIGFKLPDDDTRRRAFQSIAALADRVPVWEMQRPTAFEALPDVVNLVVSTCLHQE